MAVLIAAILFMFMGFAGGSVFAAKILGSKMVDNSKVADKHFKIMYILNQWLVVLEHGKSISLYFTQNQYQTIGIYGMGYLGKRLLAELEGTGIEIKYLLDQQLGAFYGGIPVLSGRDNLPSVDVIVVTPVTSFYPIRRQLRERTSNKIISIEEILKWHLCNLDEG